MKKVFLFLILALNINHSWAVDYYYKGTGDLNVATNWNTARNGSGTDAPTAPITASSHVYIVQGINDRIGMATGVSAQTLTVSSTRTIAAGVTLEIEDGAILTATSALTFSATAIFRLNNGATYNHNNTAAYSSTILQGVENFHSNSNFIINSSATTGPGTPTTGFGNLTFSATANVNSSGALNDVASSTGKGIQGNLTVTAVTFRLTGATSLTLTIGGNLIISAGQFTLGNGGASPIINIEGNLNMSGGILDFTGSSGASGTINFTKAGTATFTKSGGTITAATGSGRQINFVVKTGTTLDFGTNVLNSAATSTVNFTVESGAGIITANIGGLTTATTLTGSIQTGAGTRTYSTSANYTFNGTTAQVTGNGFTGANNLTINNTAGVTLTSSSTVTGTLALSAGTFTNGSNLTLANGATINRNAGSLSAEPTFGTSVNVTYSNTSALDAGFELPSSTTVLNNLTTTGTQVVRLTSSIQVNGVLAISNSGNLNVQLNTLTFAGTSITKAGGGRINLNSGGAASLTFTNTTPITLPADLFIVDNVQRLTINGSGGVTLGSSINVFNTLNLTNGNLTLGAFNITINASNFTGGSSSSYIVTNGTGRVLRRIPFTSGGTSFLFHIGRDATNYTPLTITNTGVDTSIYTVGAANTTFSPAANGANAEWSIAASVSTTSTLAFGWTTADAGATLNASPTSGKAFQKNGISWDNRGGTTTGTPNTTTVTGITDLTNPTWTVAMPDAVANITLSGISTIGASNLLQGSTNSVIYNFQLAVTTANTELNQLTIPTTGTYTSADISNLKLWYNSTNNGPGSGASVIQTIATVAGAGTETFSSFTQTITDGSTGYFWITADIAANATPSRTITITPALNTGNFTFTPTPSPFTVGTINASGTQTIVDGVDGVISTSPTNEYGDHTNGGNQQQSGTPITYMRWTDDKLYVGVTAANLAEGFVLYLDKDPQTPVNGGTNSNGTNVGFNYDGANFAELPFRADLVLYVKSGYREYRTANGSNGWNNSNAGFGTYAENGGTNTREFEIPWSVIGGKPTAFNWFSYITSAGGFVYAQVPTENAGGNIGTSARYSRYYTVSNTGVSPTLPFSRNSYVFNSTSDATNFGAISVYDFTMNTSGRLISRSNSASGAWNIAGNLVVGNGSIFMGTSGGSGYGTTTVTGNVLVSGGLLDMDFNTNALTIDGNLTLSGGTLALSNSVGGDVKLKSNWLRTGGTLTNRTRLVEFNGTTAQTISGTNTFDYLTVNNTNGVSLLAATPITVSTNINLTTNSKITLGANDLVFNGNNANLTAGTTNYIVTNGIGQFKRTVDNSAINFPVGNSTYNPITLTNAGTADVYGIRVEDGAITATSPFDISKTINRLWKITEANAGGSVLTVAATFNDAEKNSATNFDAATQPKIGLYNGSSWTQVNASGTNTFTASATLSPTDLTTAQSIAIGKDDAFIAFPPEIVLANNPGGQVAIGNITKGTNNNILFNLQLGVTVSNATLNSVSFTTTGTYSGTDDITNFKLYYNTTNNFGTASTIGSTLTSSLDAGTHTFTSLAQAINAGITGYLWITTDVKSGASVGNIIAVNAITTSDVVFALGNKTGSTTAGGVQTIVQVSSITDAFRTRASGNWNYIATWESFTDGSWINATLIPDASASTITVRNGDTVTVTANVSIDQTTIETTGQVIVNSGVTLTIEDGTGNDILVYGILKNSGTLTLTGTMEVFSQGMYDHAVSGGSTTIPTVTNITWNTGSTLKVSGTFSTATGSNAVNLIGNTTYAYANVLIDCNFTNTDAFLSLSDGNLTIDTLRITNTGNGEVLATVRNATTCGTYIQNGGLFYCNRNSGSTRNLTVTGNVSITGGALHIKNQAGAGAGQLFIGGDLAVGASGTLTNSGTAGFARLNFTGSSPQTWVNTSTFSATGSIGFVIETTGAGGVTLNDNITLPFASSLALTDGNFAVASGKMLTIAGTTTVTIGSGRILNVDGTLNHSSSGTITTTGSLSINNGARYIHNRGTATLVTATWNTGSTCEIQNIGGGTSFAFGNQTLHHLIWNNSNQAGSIQLNGTLGGVNGNLEIQNCANNASRYFRLTNATGYTLNIGGDLNISAANGQSGLDFGNSSGTNCTINVTGNVIIAAGGTIVSSATGAKINVGGNWTNGGTFTNTNTTIEFNGTSAQSITGTTAFNNLTINKSTDTLTVNNDISVASAGSLNLTAGILNDGGNTISVAGNVTGTASAQHIGIGKILMNNSSSRTFGGNISVQNIEFGGSSGTSMVASSSFVTTIFGNAIFSGNPFTVNTGNTLIFGDTANIYRNNGAANAINQTGGTINYGSTPSGLIDIFINASCNSTAEYIITQSPGIVNSLNIADGVTYTIPGSRAATTLNLNNTGILAFNPSTTLTYTINGSILGSGSISGHINASLTLTNGSNSLNLTSGSRVLNNLSIAGNGTLTLQTPVELMGNLTLTSGGVFADNGQTVTLNGNIANTGTHTSTGSGKIVLNGTTKTISGSTLGNVDIGSGCSYSLSGSPTVNGILTLLANVDLASSGYTLNLANTSVVEAGTSQMIGTGTVNIDGIFKTANTEGFTGANTSIPDATVNLGSSSTVEYTSATAQTFTTRADYKNVTISGSGEKTLTGNPTIANTLALTAGTLAVGNSNTLTISSGGSIAATSGSIATGTNGGTIAFAGTGTVSGTVTFNNVTLAGGVNFGTASTVGANGTLQLNSGGFVTTNAPEYASTATLIYNNTGSFNRTLEWSTTAGKGYPGNVLIQNGTIVNTQALSGDIGVANHLTLGTTGSAGSLNMNSATNKIIVGGNVQIGGTTGTSTLTLSSASGGDIKVGGNWTRNANGAFTSNARAIFFTGTGDNEVSGDGGELVGYLVVEKTGGSVKLLSNLTITADNAGTAMSIPSTASFDLNGNRLLFNGINQSLILADGGVVNFIGAANSTIEISNAIKTVSTDNGGTVVFGDNVLIAASTGINFGSGLSTVNGTFRINGGGFVQTNPPVYGLASTLQYNSGGSYGRFLEWSANSGAGYPANVQLSNNTTLNYPNTGGGAFSTNLSIAGNLTIDNGSALYLGFGDNGNKSGALTVAGNVTVNGNLGLGNASGGDLYVGGNWTRAAASADFFPNGRQLIFNGTGAQSINRIGGETFENNIVVNKASGVLTANNNITFDNDLTLTSGTINDGGNTLTLNGNIVNTGSHASTSSGKIVLNGTSKTISGATLGNIEIASSTISLSGNPTINGVLTLTNSLALSSLTLNLSNTSVVEAGTNQLTGTGTVNINGVFKTAKVEGFSGASSSIPSATVNLDALSTVEYAAAIAQTITARTDYKNVTLTGSAIKTLAGNTTVAGTLLLTNSTDIASISNNTLTLSGTIFGSGRIRGGSTSNLTIEGTGSLGTLNFDQTTDGTTNILNNVVVNRSSGTLALGNKLIIANVYTPTSGVLTTNNHLHIRSTASNTARIAGGSSSGGYISGDVTVERYMSASSNRAWRLVTPGVTTTTNINANWQEGKVNTTTNTNVPADVAGYGVHITGAGGNSNGFDVTQTNAASLYSFDQATQNWALITNTNVNTLDAKQGYLLFVRGNRDNIAPINTTTGSSNVILRAKGTLLQGTQTFTNLATANNFSLVTNPFASPIDWTTIYTGANATNFNGSVNIWDPNVGTRGGFVAINDIGLASNGSSLLTEHLQSGQAFFIQTKTGVIGNPSFVIEETHKSTTNNLDVYRTNNQLEKLKIQLRFTASNIQRVADGVVAIFSNTYSNGIDGRDAEQIANWDEDIALTRNGKDLSIESRNTISATDTLNLKIANLRAAQVNYRWVIEPEQLNAVGLTAFLEDNFTNTTTPISLTAATTINFTVSSNAASTAANRFRIVFRNNAALPVTITQIKAQQKGNDVQVWWNTVNEQNIQHYEVEKSTNAQQFSKIATVAAKTVSSSNDYSMVDASVPSGTYYYRLKIVEKNGSYNYSKVVRFTIGKGNINTMSIYPNPIKGNTINLQLNNVEKGNYTIKVLNYAGQVVYQSNVQHLGGSATEQIVLSKTLASGQYQLEMSNEKGMKMVQIIMKE